MVCTDSEEALPEAFILTLSIISEKVNPVLLIPIELKSKYVPRDLQPFDSIKKLFYLILCLFVIDVCFDFKHDLVSLAIHPL